MCSTVERDGASRLIREAPSYPAAAQRLRDNVVASLNASAENDLEDIVAKRTDSP